MTVLLKCPNCGANIGIAESKDNYIPKYFYRGDNNQPICKNCGCGQFENFERNLFIGVLIFIGLILVAVIVINLLK